MTRLDTARAAYRAACSPVMLSHEMRDRLAAEVDAAVECEREVSAVMAVESLMAWLRCPGTSPCWCDHCLDVSTARRVADALDLDFSVEAIASRNRR